jgi:NADP-dependent 3-hydroxy acid dehydrogenase YdfG
MRKLLSHRLELQGIGRATAIAFAQAGVKVMLTGRCEEEGKSVVDAIKKCQPHSGRWHFYR